MVTFSDWKIFQIEKFNYSSVEFCIWVCWVQNDCLDKTSIIVILFFPAEYFVRSKYLTFLYIRAFFVSKEPSQQNCYMLYDICFIIRKLL